MSHIFFVKLLFLFIQDNQIFRFNCFPFQKKVLSLSLYILLLFVDRYSNLSSIVIIYAIFILYWHEKRILLCGFKLFIRREQSYYNYIGVVVVFTT